MVTTLWILPFRFYLAHFALVGAWIIVFMISCITKNVTVNSFCISLMTKFLFQVCLRKLAVVLPRSLDIWRPHNAIKLKPGCVANEHQVCTSYAKHSDPYGVLNKSRAVNLAQYSMFFCFEAVTPLNIFCSIPHLNSDAKFSILLE